MSDSSSWWAQKLGQRQPQQPPQRPQRVEATPPVPQGVPPHQRPMAPVPQQFTPDAQQPMAPQTHPQATQVDPSQMTQQELVEANRQMMATRDYGGQIPVKADAQQRHAGTCPGCGSGNYFTGDSRGGGVHCHDCGYPLVQAGSSMGALAAVTPTGGSHQAQSPAYSQQIGG